MVLDVLGDLAVSLRSRLDTKRPQQLGGGAAGIARLTEDRMQALLGEMLEDEVDNAPGVVCFDPGFASLVHLVPTSRCFP